MNDRQQIIIGLLRHTTTTITLDKIATIVKKSKRTVMRDLSTIKVFLEQEKIGSLVMEPGEGYRIDITDYELYNEVVQKTINDEELILFELVQNEYVTMEYLAQCLFVSKITATEKMNVVRNEYANTLNIEITRKGHHLQEDSAKKCILLSNLIMSNLKNYLTLANLSYDDYYQLEAIVKNNSELVSNFPNVSDQEILVLLIAAMIMGNVEEEDYDVDFNEYLNGVLVLSRKANAILNLVSQHCIDVSLHLHKGQILEILNLMNISQIVGQENYEELASKLYEHLKRMVSYPYYVNVKTLYNIKDIQAMNPFAFDLSITFIDYFRHMYHYDVPNPDFIGLYFTICIEKYKKEKKKVLIYSNFNAIAYLNRQLLVDQLNDVEVEICERLAGDSLSNVTLIIDCKGDLKLSDKAVYKLHNIITDSDIRKVREMMDNIYIKQNKHKLFPQEYSFEYHVTNTDWSYILEEICLRLQSKKAITKEEAHAIVDREKRGNALIINDFSIPHCISTRENICVCIYIHLDQKIEVESQTVNNVLLTITDPLLNKNTNIFRFLYNYLNDQKDDLEHISTYDEFVKNI